MILSIPGLVRTILIIVAIIVILRFVGQLMNAKRNVAAENKINQEKQREEQDRKNYERNKGRVTISRKGDRDAVDTDFEEIK
jgi:uncharacterized membrane protein YhiD involved in acid resistance